MMIRSLGKDAKSHSPLSPLLIFRVMNKQTDRETLEETTKEIQTLTTEV